ncbi:FAD-binding domain-containing protein [Aspergillus novofumigatus IBT 16806]|uniref:FAD-binding domain-containing protein n=1 Tax=Aspergillus novofumigatus (strain IBT 16806) TaxID=1392255 RepID=A0A2I1C7B9_ASPN1|nr:FAD-binding domain-containing protein [Aspergillus novofumigatus IBT 16806]PKX93529.1 FAD-binding domain-containing protein [Aspergillus novofumigatus IBT 16806]
MATEAIIQDFIANKVPVFRVGEVEYERSVATANLLYRFTRPDCVVQPEGAGHVQFIVTRAKARDVSLTIKNGGHSYAGFSSTDTGILLDLVRMKKVEIDRTAMIATLQAYDGAIINGGRCPTVGVSGFTLGGGLGPFTRRFGMGCDTLKEATIVTADGKLVTVRDSDDPKSDKGRLFWALCGAGGGNFGVVVELKLKIQEQITLDTSWLRDLKDTSSELSVRVLSYFDGSKDDFDDVINRFVEQPELKKQLKRRSMAEPSTRFLHETLVSQWSEETVKSFPTNRSYQIYTSFVFKNDRSRMKAVTVAIRKEMQAFRRLFKGEQGLLQVTWIHSGGEASRKKRSATAFRWRDCTYHIYIMLQWEDKWLERDMWGFLGEFKKQLQPYSMMGRAAFINFPDRTLTTTAHEKVYYGNNRQELQRIKRIWDPDNFFDWGQGIQSPTSTRQNVEFQSRILPISLSSETAAADEEEEGGEDVSLHEKDLTDKFAGPQWKDVALPPQNAVGGTGVFALTDLGF